MQRTDIVLLSAVLTFGLLAMGSYAAVEPNPVPNCVGGASCTVYATLYLPNESDAKGATVTFAVNKIQYPYTPKELVANGTLAFAECAKPASPIAQGGGIVPVPAGTPLSCKYQYSIAGLNPGYYILNLKYGTEQAGNIFSVEDSLYLNQKILSISSITSILSEAKVMSRQEDFDAKESGGRIVYEVNGGDDGRLLGIMPVTVPVKATVDAQSGAIMGTERAWWSLLVFR